MINFIVIDYDNEDEIFPDCSDPWDEEEAWIQYAMAIDDEQGSEGYSMEELPFVRDNSTT